MHGFTLNREVRQSMGPQPTNRSSNLNWLTDARNQQKTLEDQDINNLEEDCKLPPLEQLYPSAVEEHPQIDSNTDGGIPITTAGRDREYLQLGRSSQKNSTNNNDRMPTTSTEIRFDQPLSDRKDEAKSSTSDRSSMKTLNLIAYKIWRCHKDLNKRLPREESLQMDVQQKLD